MSGEPEPAHASGDREGAVRFGSALPPGALPAGERVQSQHWLDLEPVPRVVSAARTFVAEHAPALDPDTHDTVVLLTSELATNAVIHARTPLVVGVTVTDASVLVMVHDLDLGRREIDAGQRDGGRGLAMVRALADAFDIHVEPGGGKTAWFRVPRHPRDARAQWGEGAPS